MVSARGKRGRGVGLPSSCWTRTGQDLAVVRRCQPGAVVSPCTEMTKRVAAVAEGIKLPPLGYTTVR